ncbi:cytochrome P450 2J6-like [Dermacentor variabilis]|uniref:cytochrome P450 2J6-like n=1 Tax=Dermacentor variabilis TaxID=34621 RepID=UPI003F5CB62D
MLYTFCNYVIVGLVAGLGVAILQYLIGRKRQKDLPPGPIGFPLLGYLPFVLQHWDVEALRKKYGNVFGLKIGSRYVVFLCDFDSVKEALTHNALLNRPEEFPLNVSDTKSLITLNGPVWKEQRRFLLRTLKQLGAGTPAMEARIQQELSYLLHELQVRDGKPAVPADLLTASVSNIMTELLMATRFGHKHPNRAHIDELVDAILVLSVQVTAVNLLPWLRRCVCCFTLGAYGKLKQVFVNRSRFGESGVSKAEKTYEDGLVRSFTDAYIAEMKRRGDGNRLFTRELLIGNVASYFGGGSGTMRSALEWLLLMSAAKPDLQARVRTEVDAVMERKEPSGSNRVSWTDRARMPYTQAFVWEVMRAKPVNPLGLMRSASADINLGGYFVPRGSIVIPSFWSVFNEASFWGDPEVFRPERFLSDDGKSAKKSERLIPFSYGKRSCPGESVAVMVVFMFFTNILRHFSVEAPYDGAAALKDEVLGIAMRPVPRELVFMPRA